MAAQREIKKDVQDEERRQSRKVKELKRGGLRSTWMTWDGVWVKGASKVVVLPLAHPSSLIFSFSQNSGVCKQDWGPCLLMRTGGDKLTVCICVSVCV